MPAQIFSRALARPSGGVTSLGSAFVARRQRIAATILRLGVLPRPIEAMDAVRQARS